MQRFVHHQIAMRKAHVSVCYIQPVEKCHHILITTKHHKAHSFNALRRFWCGILICYLFGKPTHSFLFSYFIYILHVCGEMYLFLSLFSTRNGKCAVVLWIKMQPWEQGSALFFKNNNTHRHLLFSLFLFLSSWNSWFFTMVNTPKAQHDDFFYYLIAKYNWPWDSSCWDYTDWLICSIISREMKRYDHYDKVSWLHISH